MTRVRVLMARHAESVLNLKGKVVGGRSNHVDLTERGCIQAVRLGRFLDRNMIRPVEIYASPAVRTLRTCDIALSRMSLPYRVATPVIAPEIQEMDQGEWTGRLRREIYIDAVLAMIAARGKDARAPGGESMNEVGARMLAWADRVSDAELVLAQARSGRFAATATAVADVTDTITVMAVTHGLAARCLVSEILDWSQRRTFTTVTPNASLTSIVRELGGGPWEVEYVGASTE